MELTPVAARTGQDILVDISPDGPVTDFAVDSSDDAVLVDGVIDPSNPNRARLVGASIDGSTVLTISAKNSRGDLLSDTCVVTFTTEVVATNLNSTVTAVDK